MKIVKAVLIGLLVILVLIQLIRPEKNTHPGPHLAAISNKYPMTAQVKAIMEKACNDCHSNNTKYPWYSRVQPVAWWLNNHITEGKHDLNFDEFLNYAPKKQAKKMEEMQELVKEKLMPISTYTWIHKDARLTSGERDVLTNWAGWVQAQIEQTGGLHHEKKD